MKLSILLQYSRIFNPAGKRSLPLLVTIQLSIWSIVIFYLVQTFFTIFQCNPRQKIWNKLITTGHCYDIYAMDKATGVFNVISDFVILVLPMSSIWRLQMALRKKLLISGVFAVGFL